VSEPSARAAAVGSFAIEPRFCGPPRSANGGYVAGRLAHFVEPTDELPDVEVTLRKPPPLAVPLEVVPASDGVQLMRADVVIAVARPGRVGAPPPPSVPYEQAGAAAERYTGRVDHPFPTCFVCGPERSEDDGLRLEPGSVAAPGPAEMVAASWRPHRALLAAGAQPHPDGLSPEFVWAALDCPGGWSTSMAGRPMVLGRITAHIASTPRAGQPCVVVGRLLGRDGRKAFTASALYDAQGQLLAHATATWFDVDPATVTPD
jgi:hypothetical protein